MFWIFFISLLFASTPKDGFWRFNLHYPQGKVPFVMEIKKDKATLFNGKEKLILSDLEFKNNTLTIPLQTYQNALTLKFDDNKAQGHFTRLNKKPQEQFKVDGAFGYKERFDQIGSDAKIAGKWSIEMTSLDGNKTPGILVIESEKNKIYATILTSFGDYRYFEGFIQKNHFELAS